MGLSALADDWRITDPFIERHVWPAGCSPRDHHPKHFGKLTSTWYGCRRDGSMRVVVRSTKRLEDGWSYNVAVERDRPSWVSWFHHAPTGKRIRHLGSDKPLDLALAFDVVVPLDYP